MGLDVWPDGKKAAASFTFDVDAESPWLAMDPQNAGRPGLLSLARYGPRVGVPLILDVLRHHGVRGTFFLPGVNVELYPETVAAIVQEGHELALHGYTHTAPADMTPEQEAEELERAYELLTGAGGVVTGYRSPSWDVSRVTLDLLEAKGLRYSSQFMDDLRPYRHPGRRIVELPIQWLLDDWPHFAWAAQDAARTIRSAPEVELIWREELEGIRRLGGSFVLTMHPQVIGRPSRIAMLDRLIDHTLSLGDVWVTTCADIASHADRELP
jgi:peptidoglycan/xylan/chitin deacetylase (PgdA/CDA1 family)